MEAHIDDAMQGVIGLAFPLLAWGFILFVEPTV